MYFNLEAVPFSRYGSYLAFSHIEHPNIGPAGLCLQTVHGSGSRAREIKVVFHFDLIRAGKTLPVNEVASPTILRLEADDGWVEICIAEPQLIRIRGDHIGLRLTRETDNYDRAIQRGDDQWQVVSFETMTNYILTPIQGELRVDAPWTADKSDHVVADLLPDPDTGRLEAAIEEFINGWQKREYDERFEDYLSPLNKEYVRWQEIIPAVPETYAEARDLAAYITWSSVVEPNGHLTRPAMLMSKNGKNHLCGWTNCFNAMVLVYRYPELAWHQFRILLDHQDANGKIPDSVNDRVVEWSFCQPPIHGWALRWMMERTDFIDKSRLAEIYESLSRWTQWWFDYRDDDGDAVPQYNHGRDAGWANSTAFSIRPPIESPDLSAYLIIQMDALAEAAQILGRQREANTWSSRARVLLDLLFRHSWDGDQFVAPRSGDHEAAEAESLLSFMPIILGNRLPKYILAKLVRNLKEEGKFLTTLGLATESLSSPWYQSDGSGRGSIWPPATMLLIDGLVSAGEIEFAQELSRRFCDMVSRSGLAESYDAITGKGLRDQAYTGTSSVFLILAHEYLPG